MSRIGKKAVAIPSGVNVTIDGQTVTVKGPKGQLAWTIADEIAVSQEGSDSC
jgi:large subunit ribosomal protein L6